MALHLYVVQANELGSLRREYAFLEETLGEVVSKEARKRAVDHQITFSSGKPEYQIHQFSADLEFMAAWYLGTVTESEKAGVCTTSRPLSFRAPCDILPVREKQFYQLRDLSSAEQDQFCRLLYKHITKNEE